MKALVTVTLTALLFSTCLAHAAERRSAQDQTAPTATAVQAQKVDINRATREDLIAVPGIGQHMAEAIIDLRSRKGAFSKVEDLLEVPGIKEKKLASLVEHLAVAPLQPSAATPQPK